MDGDVNGDVGVDADDWMTAVFFLCLFAFL